LRGCGFSADSPSRSSWRSPEDQDRIDSLLAAPEWNEEEARAIVFDQNVEWGYREYVDLFRADWELNRELDPGAPRFRLLGVNDSPDWSQVRDREDREDAAIMARVWRGGGEEHWAEAILDAVGAGRKVLVYSGIHHAFTGYRQPVVLDGEFVRFDDTRMANHVYRAIGRRAATVFLHAPWVGVNTTTSVCRRSAMAGSIRGRSPLTKA